MGGDWVPLSLKEGETLAECWAFRAHELLHTGICQFPFPLFLSLNVFQNRGFHPEAFTRPFHHGRHTLGTDPGFLLHQNRSSNTLHSSIPRPSWLTLPGQTISTFPPKPRARLSGDNESFVRHGGQSCPGWSLGTSTRWPPPLPCEASPIQS